MLFYVLKVKQDKLYKAFEDKDRGQKSSSAQSLFLKNMAFRPVLSSQSCRGFQLEDYLPIKKTRKANNSTETAKSWPRINQESQGRIPALV